MRKSVTNFYNVDDMKGLIKTVLKSEKVATTDDLEKFVTTKEIEKILEQYPTKADLTQALLKNETSLKNTIIEFKDAILHEIKGLREDHVIITGYKDQIEDHETRIDKLEKVAFPD